MPLSTIVFKEHPTSALVRIWQVGALALLFTGSAYAQTPTLTELSPARNARSASQSADVTATFGQTLGNTPSTQQALKVFSQQAGGQKTGTTTVSGSMLTFNPTVDFKPGETVQATVTTGVQSSGGQNLASAQIFQFTTAVTPSNGTFGGGANVAVGVSTQGLAVGDIDGDGDLDLAAPSSVESGIVNIRRNNGSGSFTGSEVVAVGPYTRSVALGDVDGDGDLDLVTANGTSNAAVSIRLNNGSGVFSGTQNIELNREMNDVALGDMDGDGDLDIVVGGPVGIVIMIRNLGGGTFTGISSFLYTNNEIYSLVLGDVDNDGDLDFIGNGYNTDRTIQPGQVRVGFNDGTGTFVLGNPITVGPFSQSVAAGDLDGDGDLDLAVASRLNNTVSFLRNNGSGIFTSASEIAVTTALSVSLNDVDGDGDLDLLTGSFSEPYQVSVRLNNGAGSFSGSQQVSTGSTSVRLALADVDGDGDLDLLSAGGSTVSVRLNRSQPVLTSLSATAGAAGSSLVLTGSGFTGATSVTFNGVPATSFVVNSATQITVTVPAGATSGPVVVTTPEGTSNGLAFTVSAAPVVTAVSPTRNSPSALRTAPVGVTYSQPLSDNLATRQALRVFSQQAGGRKSGTATVFGNSIVFTPGSAFKAGETVYATATAAAQSSTGVAAVPHVFQFTAATAPTSGVITGSDVNVGTGPESVATGDLDGDGDLDFVTKGNGSTVSVQLNNGAGTFVSGTPISVGDAPSRYALGDLDGDGDLDLLTVNLNKTVSVRLNNGTGTFSGAQEIAFPEGLSTQALTLVVGDVDGDGDLDFVASTSTPSQLNTSADVIVRLNNGAGVFGGGSNLTIGNTTELALGDIDGDGDLDLLAPYLGNGRVVGNAVIIRLNDGTGQFNTNGSAPIIGYLPTSIALGDLDRDGDLDLVTATQALGVNVRLNDGAGVFSGSQDLSSPGSVRVALGDVDGDGDLDILTTNSGISAAPGTTSIYLNDGVGSFVAPRSVAVGVNPIGIVTGDLDGNNTLDFLVANANSNTVSVRLSQAVGTAALAINTVSPARNARSAARATDVVVTFNQALSAGAATQQALKVFSAQAGGKKAGAAAVSGNNLVFNPTADFKPGETVYATVTTAAQSSSGASLTAPQVFQFTAATSPSSGSFGGGTQPTVGTNPLSVTTGDVDGDGDLDLLTANLSTNTVSVRLNNGAGSFSGSQEVSVGRGPFQVVLGDVDGDGDLDLATANSRTIFPGTVSVRLNNGQGTFGAGTDVTVGDTPHALALADLDGDGDLDLLAANYTAGNSSTNSTVSVRLNSGTGSFSGTQEVSIGTRPVSLAVGDVDGDGDLDFLTANSNQLTASLRLNDGNGTFTGTTDVPVGANPEAVTLGDVDGDNDLDLVVANGAIGRVRVLPNAGNGTFSSGQEIAVGALPRGAVLGDVDGDGDLDLATPNNGYDVGSTASVRLNNGSGNFSGTQEVSLGAAPNGLALADLDGDGDLDLLTANSSASTVSVRLNQSAARVLAASAALTEQVGVYPNPARTTTRLQLPASLVAQPLHVRVLNAMGQVVLEQQLTAQQNAGNPQLVLGKLPSGVYSLRLSTGAGVITKRLLVE